MKFLKDRPYYLLFVVLAGIGFVGDQASKYIVFAKLYPSGTDRISQFDVIPGYFALRTFYLEKSFDSSEPFLFLRTVSGERIPHVNRGALFGIGNGDGESGGANHIFAGISILAAAFILVWASRPAVAQDRFLSLALGLILGGTLGNLYDRIVFSGVRDFLHCYYESHVWPDFNIADSCLVVGAGVLLVHSFFAKEPITEPAKAQPLASEAAVPMAPVKSV